MEVDNLQCKCVRVGKAVVSCYMSKKALGQLGRAKRECVRALARRDRWARNEVQVMRRQSR